MFQRLLALVPVRTLALLIGTLLVGMMPPASSFAQDGSAREFLQGIYKNYVGANSRGVDFSKPATAGRYFEASVVEQIMKQDPDSEYEGGGLDFDPFANGQEIEIKSVEVTVPSETGERAKAVASFRNAGRQQVVTFDLVKTAKGWRIANISWRGATETLQTILAKRL